MGSLVRTGANALAAYGGVNPFAEAGRGAETGDYLKFNGNSGELTYGADDETLPLGSYLVADLATYAQGFICWKESAVVEEILVSVLEGRPPREVDLPDHGPFDDDDDGWREAGSISFILLEHGTEEDAGTHADVGKPLLFKTSTGGAVRSLKKLSAAYGRVFMSKPGELPVIEVTADSYTPKVKKHGTKHAINLKIVGWITEGELAAIAQGGGDNADDYEEPEPVAAPPARRVAPAAVAQADPAPARRRAPRAAAQVLEPEVDEEEAPPPPARRRAPAVVEPDPIEDEAPEGDESIAPEPRGRSPGRGAPPANARVRRFA